MSKLPKVKQEIVDSLLVDIFDDRWVIDTSRRLELDNPTVCKYLRVVNEKVNPEAALVGLIVYRMLESQIEADNLTELFNDTP